MCGYWDIARCVDTWILQDVWILEYCKVCEYWDTARCVDMGYCKVRGYWDTARCVRIELRRCVKVEHKVDVLSVVSHHQRFKENQISSWNSL